MVLAFVLVGNLAGLELSSTCLALLLTGGSLGHFHSLTVPFLFSSTAALLCKTPLLLLRIIGLAAALLEIEEGHVTFPIKQL
jgi:hypothetical protein